jgi:Protein of unknown function (DUF2924)
MREPMTEVAAIAAEIARIRALAPAALGRCWRAVFGRKPPAGLSRDLLGRMIAMRIQEQAFGGLDRDSLAFLDAASRTGGNQIAETELAGWGGRTRTPESVGMKIRPCCRGNFCRFGRNGAAETVRVRAAALPTCSCGKDFACIVRGTA